jgi:Holliday junction resolvasome RuvABC endonuclease subunit
MSKIRLEDIQVELEKDNWKIISDSYTNLDSELIFQCPEGHTVYSSWKKIRNKKVCPICEQNIYKTEAIDSKIIPKKKGVHRTLGLDQATKVSGFSIFDDDKLIKYGTFTTSLENVIARASAVKIWLINIINNWQPDLVVMEGIQLQEESSGRPMGVTTFQSLAWLQGILMECCYELGIPYEVCHTSIWREHCKVKGKTRADKKRSMQLMAKQWYDISVSDDAADAIGIGKYGAEVLSNKKKIVSWE